jgi:hypothetical protein
MRQININPTDIDRNKAKKGNPGAKIGIIGQTIAAAFHQTGRN